MVKKHLGQHFLIDERVAQREVSSALLQPDDVVLEIGPGTGVLTLLLAKQVKQVIAIEIDQSLVRELSKRLPKNVLLIPGDAVDIDFQTFPVFTKIVSNLPFQISSPITFKLLSYPFSRAILMYQKDFAERMIAKPGTKQYSRLSVGVYYKSFCRILEAVPRTAFSPQPKIESCVVELLPRVTPPFTLIDELFFFYMIKTLFSHRRKQIKNSVENILKISPEKLPFMTKRVEELTPEELGTLSNLLYTRSQSKK
ncbi:MAG: 16S rRNA (adenine(1518)-N(6)/adenine(1519)-N(6))-dimethyltransferase RsmA [Methanobacteriota archaeon]